MSDNVKSFLKSHSSIMNVAFVFILGLLLIIFSPSLGGGAELDTADKEKSLSEICASVAGVGECETIISYGESGEVIAVAVVCEGADLVSVRATLTDMIGSLYGIGSHRISIVKSK